MAIYRDRDAGVMGHLPREIAKTCHYFTRYDGKISRRVTGRRIHSEEAGERDCISEIFGNPFAEIIDYLSYLSEGVPKN